MKNDILFLFLSFILITACGEHPQQDETTATAQQLIADDNSRKEAAAQDVVLLADSSFRKTYNFATPDQTFPLPGALVEISGLSYYPTDNQLLAINDEIGLLYYINPESGKVEDTARFGNNGDYEGIEYIGEKICITKSNGDLYFYNTQNGKTEDVLKTKFNSSNDVEGLAYDQNKNELLVACKGNPNIGDTDKYKKEKNIYRYDLRKKEIEKKPLLNVEDDDSEDFVKKHGKKLDLSKSALKKLRNRAKDFSPSGIAIHPTSGDYYVISSQGKTLMIFDREKDLRAIVFLDAGIHRQPEGICFTPDGTLYISNEGKGLGARLMKFLLAE
ncbi:MAG: SdiA-regulated domain-containing protein [Bacteroidota bacterium]